MGELISQYFTCIICIDYAKHYMNRSLTHFMILTEIHLAPGCRYRYPTLDQLAETLDAVHAFFQLRTVIGLGMGAGANILTRFAVC